MAKDLHGRPIALRDRVQITKGRETHTGYVARVLDAPGLPTPPNDGNIVVRTDGGANMTVQAEHCAEVLE